MAALSASLPQLKTRVRGVTNTTVLKNSTTFYLNSLVGLASGVLVPWADTAGFKFRGLLVDAVDATVVPVTNVTKVVGDTSATPPPRGIVDETGKIVLNVAVAGIVATSKGARVYCATDNPEDMTLTPTTNVPAIGEVEEFVSTGRGDVRLYTPAEIQAAIDFGTVAALTGSTGGTANSAIETMAALTDYTKHASGGTTVTSNAATDLDTTAAALETFRDEQAALNAIVANNIADLVGKVNAILAL